MIDKETIRYIAKLACLKFSPEEEKKILQDLNEILKFVKELETIDTKDVKPTFHPLPLKNVYREDKSSSWFTTEMALKNAPKKEGNYFKIPKII